MCVRSRRVESGSKERAMSLCEVKTKRNRWKERERERESDMTLGVVAIFSIFFGGRSCATLFSLFLLVRRRRTIRDDSQATQAQAKESPDRTYECIYLYTSCIWTLKRDGKEGRMKMRNENSNTKSSLPILAPLFLYRVSQEPFLIVGRCDTNSALWLEREGGARIARIG